MCDEPEGGVRALPNIAEESSLREGGPGAFGKSWAPENDVTVRTKDPPTSPWDAVGAHQGQQVSSLVRGQPLNAPRQLPPTWGGADDITPSPPPLPSFARSYLVFQSSFSVRPQCALAPTDTREPAPG